MLTVARYSSRELLRSRWIFAYGLFFTAVAWGLMAFGEDPAQTVASVLDLVLLVVPLVGTVVGVIHFYNSREFAELLLVQPVDRRSVFIGQYLGLAACLAAAFVVGMGIPFLWYGFLQRAQAATLGALLAAGVFLTLIFVALAFAMCVRTENRLKALGAAIFLWLFFAVIYDAILLGVVMEFDSYPLEGVLLGLILFNPLDMARLLILLRLDVAALMGYTGAAFKQFFGSGYGMGIALGALALWTAIPMLWGAAAYARRDF